MVDERFRGLIDRLLDEVEAASVRGEWDEVHERAEDVLLIDPDNEVAQRWQALARKRTRQGRERNLGRDSVRGERRHLTVMFSDVVGSTELAARLDPEVWRQVLLAYQRGFADAIGREDGHVAHWLGDGVLAYFGYPVAHEDAPVRAVLAGLAAVRGLDELAPTLARRHGVDLSVRVGIHSGLVVLAEMGVDEWVQPLDVVGETPNLAARVQAEAEPGTVALSDSTYDLVRGLVEVRPMGVRALRGISRPVEVFQAVGTTTARTRYEVLRHEIQPLVGRADELARLEACWHAEPGRPASTAVVVGEPGIGKSRLADEVANRAVAVGLEVLVLQCSPRLTSAPLRPMLGLIEARAGIETWDEPEVRVRKVEQLVLPRNGEAVLPWLLWLMGLPAGAHTRPDVSAELALQETIREVAAWLGRMAAARPVLVVVEDAHWIDPSTRELVRHVVGTPGLGLVATSRSQGDRTWLAQLGAQEVVLQPLGASDTAALVRALPYAEAIDPEALALVVGRSDGIPLFAQELARMLTDAGSITPGAPGSSADIPASLQDLLVSRLDRIPDARELAQVAASIAREVPHPLLAAVVDLDTWGFRAAVDDLVAAGIWEPTGLGEFATYRFRHRLIQEAAYQSQLLARRREVHERVADVLRRQFPELVDDQPELLADHLERSGDALGAVRQWQAAGVKATQQGAHPEAVARFQHALALLATELADHPEAGRLELGLQLRLGASLSTSQGYGASEVEPAFRRARELSGRLGNPPELFPALWGSWTHHLVRGRYDVAEDLAEQCMAIAEATGDDRLAMDALTSVGTTAFYQGRFADALAAHERALALHAAGTTASPLQQFQHPAVPAASISAAALALTGRLAESAERLALALAIADAVEERLRWFGLTYAASFAAWLGGEVGDPHASIEHAERCIALGTQHGIPMLLAAGEMHQGYAEAVLGDVEGGRARLARGLARFTSTGAALQAPYFTARLAEVYERAGDDDAALPLLDDALALADRNGEGMYEADLLRRKGSLLQRAARGGRAEAGAALVEEAWARSAGQGAWLLALRAALDLGGDARVVEALTHVHGGAGVPEVAAARVRCGPAAPSS